MLVGGLTPLTTIDFPGRLAAVVFCQGCPWRCGYCQNEHLIPRQTPRPVPWQQVLQLLERRQGLLDGVVFSGGEPTLQDDLPERIEEVRALGYEIGLHTAGPYPERLARVLPHVTWVGLDVKGALAGYPALTGGGEASARRIRESLSLVLASGVDHEVRTTVHPDLLDREAILALARELVAMGVRRYALQRCASARCLSPRLRTPAHASPLDAELARRIGQIVPEFLGIRA